MFGFKEDRSECLGFSWFGLRVRLVGLRYDKLRGVGLSELK